jgi:hypothetical protein
MPVSNVVDVNGISGYPGFISDGDSGYKVGRHINSPFAFI